MEALLGSRGTKTRTKLLAPAKVLTGLLYGPDLGLPMTCDTDESSSRVACRFTQVEGREDGAIVTAKCPVAG
jgi:hypothetical protein